MLPLHPISTAVLARLDSFWEAPARQPGARADWRDDPHQRRLLKELATCGTRDLTPEEWIGWAVLRDVVDAGEDCLSASCGANPTLLLDAFDASALHLALASLPAGLFRPRSEFPMVQGLVERLSHRGPATLSGGDLDALASALRCRHHLQHAGSLLLRQEALFAEWANAAPTEARALVRERVCLAILDATAHMADQGRVEMSAIDLPFAASEPAELPPSDSITQVCYDAGKALRLSCMSLNRVGDPEQFKQSAEKLQIHELECSSLPLPEGCDLASLRSIEFTHALTTRADQEALLSLMRSAPDLASILLPQGMSVSGPLPQGWVHHRDLGHLERTR